MKTPMTVEGAEMLRAELKTLKSEARPRVIQAIAEAREHGDLKENAEYHAAREEQGFIEGRIQEIEGKLSGAQVIDVSKIAPTGKVIFGVTVQLINVDTDEEQTWRIVGDDEAPDPTRDWFYCDDPALDDDEMVCELVPEWMGTSPSGDHAVWLCSKPKPS